jgi:hypothetical protein
MTACLLNNPYPQEITHDEYLIILHANNLYEDFLGVTSNENNLSEFFKTHINTINKGVEHVKELRDFKAGTIKDLSKVSFNPIINYYINNNIDNHMLKMFDYYFTKGYFNALSKSDDTFNFKDALNLSDLSKVSIAEGIKKNVLISFFASLLGEKSRKIKELNSGLNSDGKTPLNDYDREFNKNFINYVNSLFLIQDSNFPIVTLQNLKQNTRLKELLKYLGRDGFFKVDEKAIENINEDIENLEESVQIYDKDPLTENPSDKISGRLKFLLRGIRKYDSKGNELKKGNYQMFWEPSDLIFKVLKRISNNNIHNSSLDQILDKLKKLSESREEILAKPVAEFLKRLELINSNNPDLDIYTDLFLYFQQSLVGIKILEQKNQIEYASNEFEDNERVVIPHYKLVDKTQFSGYDLSKFIEQLFSSVLFNNELNNYLKNGTFNFTQITPEAAATKIFNSISYGLTLNNADFISKLASKIKSLNSSLTLKDLNNVLKELIKVEDIVIGDAGQKVFNVNNDTLFPVTSPSEFSEELSIINNSIDAINAGLPFEETEFYAKFQNDVIVLNSIWSDYIKNSGNKVKVSIFTAFKTEDKQSEYSNFTRKELLANFFNILLDRTPQSQTIHTPILSDKSNLYLVDNYNFDYNSSFSEDFSLLALENITSTTTNPNSVSISHFNYIMSFLKIDYELNKKIKNGEFVGKNINKAFGTQSLFLFNPEYYGVATNEDVLELYEQYENSDKQDKDVENKLREIILNTYNVIGNQLLNEFKNNNLLLEQDGVITYNQNELISSLNYPKNQVGSEKLIDDIKRAAIDSFVFNTHLSLLTNGHPAFFKQNDEAKRYKIVVADSKKANIGASYKGEKILQNNTNRRIILKDANLSVEFKNNNEELINETLISLQEKGLKGDALLSKMANIFSNGSLLDGTKIFTTDKEKLDTITEEYTAETKDLQEELNNIKDKTSQKYLDLNAKLEEIKDSFDKRIKNEIKYKESNLANTTDASSIMSLDFSRKYHVGYNMHSDDQEQFYQNERKGVKAPIFTRQNNKIVKNVVYTKVNRNGVSQPYIEKTSTDNFTADQVFFGDSPNLYQAMIGKMFGYTFNEATKSWSYNPENAIVEKVVYESAVKAEMPLNNTGSTIIVDLEQIIKDNNITNLDDVNNFKISEDFINENVIDITIEEDRLQVETPEHLEGQGDAGSQLEALIHNAIEPENNYFIKNKNLTGTELTQLINDLKKSTIDAGNKKLLELYTSENISELYELISELYNERDFLDIESLTPEKIPFLLNNPQFGLAVTSKIQSKIKKNLIKTKMNTFQLFNGVVGYSDDYKIIIEKDVDANGNTFSKVVFEVGIPAISEEIFNAALNPDTQELDVNLLPKELREMIVYRIPTEAIYSMFVIKVKKLLKPTAGPIIYMPIGTTTIAGFDMDIDKVFGLLKNYNKTFDGKLKVIDYSLEKDNNINFKEWLKENISNTDKIEIDRLNKQKDAIVESNKEILNTNSRLKELLSKKKQLRKAIEDTLVDNYDLTDSQVQYNISNQLLENKEYVLVNEEIKEIYKSEALRNLDVIKRDFQKIEENKTAIVNSYKKDWKELSVTDQMSSLQLQNLYFDILTNVISDTKNLNTYLTGNNFDRLEEQSKEIDSRKEKSDVKYKKKKELDAKLPYKDKNLINQVNTFTAIMSGADNIGPTAVFNQFLAYLKFLNNLNPDNNYSFTFSNNIKITNKGETFNLFKGLNNMKTASGLEASLANAVLLAQAVDNIKKDLSVPLNLHKNLMSLRSLLYTIGLDENLVDRLFTDIPLIDNLIKASIANGELNKFNNNIFSNPPLLEGVSTRLVKFNEDGTKEINLDLINKKFKKGESIKDTLSTVNDKDILLFLSVMFDASKDLNSLIQIMNAFYKGLGKNFAELSGNFVNIQNFLDKNNDKENKEMAPSLNFNIEGSFIEYKLKTLLNTTNTILNVFNINLNDPGFRTYQLMLLGVNEYFAKKYANHALYTTLSFNLYSNLINNLNVDRSLKELYFEEIQILQKIFSLDNNIVEMSPLKGVYKISNTQNSNLNNLKALISFTEVNNLFFQSTEEANNFKKLYPYDIRFINKFEKVDNISSPKKIMDILSTDYITKYTISKQGSITEDKVFTAREIAQKIFFVNMVKSAVFPGKSREGRSNMFDMLFIDNLHLWDNILHTNLSYAQLLRPTSLDYSNLNGLDLQVLKGFLLMNNEDLFNNSLGNLDKIYDFKTSQQLKLQFNQTPTNQIVDDRYLTNVVSINFNTLNITGDEKQVNKVMKRLAFVTKKPFIIINNNGVDYLYQRVYQGNGNIYYKNLGIVSESKVNPRRYSPKMNNTNFEILESINNKALPQNNIVTSSIEEAEVLPSFDENVESNETPNSNQFYEGNITPEPNTVFVFGSNPEGIHGAGAASVAKSKFGAIQGKGFGLQGNSFALPTKDLKKSKDLGLYSQAEIKKFAEEKLIPYYKNNPFSNVITNNPFERSISPQEIVESIKVLYQEALNNPTKEFKIAFGEGLFGYTLNGYLHGELIEMFNAAGQIPSNIVFSKEWFDTGKLNLNTAETPTNNNPKDFTNYSGAAQGGDTIWENVGKEFGLGKQVNYRPEDLQKLTKEQLQEVESAYQQAVKDLGRKVLDANTFAGGLVRRDYLQAKAADAIFAISTIVQPNEKDPKGYVNKTTKPLVAGGTGYAVQMAINLGKPVYVFDQIKNKWFVWNNNTFLETTTPILTQKFAGIGTREINENGKQAIRDVYENTFKTPTTEQVDNKDTYQYFGANYTIVLDENNKGIDIENYSKNSSETQTKFQERKQKLLNAYNDNPNVDPQNGKPFRNVDNNTTLQNNTKEESKFKFSYKGTTIDTEFELTNQQRQALERLIDFTTEESYESKDWKDNGITLNGFAGTGKTSVIGYLQKYLQEKNPTIRINYLAPTHAATTELAFATVKTGNNVFPQTVASAIGVDIDYNTGEKNTVLRKKLSERLNPYGNNILVIDELSMLNSTDYNLVKDVATKLSNIKVIFMGDPLQIPEVTENVTEKEISKGFTELEQINLTEVKRTKDNDILNVLTALRNNINSLIPVVDNTPKLQYLSKPDFNKNLAQKFKEDPENTIFISYTKASVSSANKNIREGVLGITGDLQKGEVLTGYLGYQSKQVEKGHLANSIRYTVNSVNKKDSEYIINTSSEKLNQLQKLGMKVPAEASFTYLQLSSNDAIKFKDLTDSDFENNNKKLSTLFNNINDLHQKAVNKKINWRLYYSELESLSKIMADINLGDSYIYNPETNRMEKYTNSETHQKIKKTHNALFVEKGVDFGYGVNTHKTQGQTIKNVFYSTEDLPKGNVATLKLNGEFFGYEKHSLNYVAMSRASENLYVLKENNNQFYKLENDFTSPPTDCI